MFGAHKHRAPSGYFGGSPYGDLRYAGTDGMNIVHAGVWVKCTTCAERFELVRVHLTEEAWGAVEKARNTTPKILRTEV